MVMGTGQLEWRGDFIFYSYGQRRLFRTKWTAVRSNLEFKGLTEKLEEARYQ